MPSSPARHYGIQLCNEDAVRPVPGARGIRVFIQPVGDGPLLLPTSWTYVATASALFYKRINLKERQR